MSRPAVIDGVVTHIQRFSVHDGPGIRTTVFLKGCQMRCPWCHNPETYRSQPELQVFAERCIGCGACVDRCPERVREIVRGRQVYHRDQCTACGRCADACYARSLVIAGKIMTAEQVIDEVLADRAFYDPAGGVTLSGGEPLLQPAFCWAILELCRVAGVHTAMETNLAWEWSRVVPLLPLVDLFLVDVKLLDEAEHRHWTGVSNENVLANLKRLGAEGKPVIVRTPVVSSVNDRPEQIGVIADWLATLPNVRLYELLPYHPLGFGKFAALGLMPPRTLFSAPPATTLKNLAARAQQGAFEVKIAGLRGGRAAPGGPVRPGPDDRPFSSGAGST
jgi:pyruvate formate lyase activating enzyme